VRRLQVQALYNQGEEEASWFITTAGENGEIEERPALIRHKANNRSNAVAKEQYCSLIIREGVLPELRAPPAQKLVC
jgi:hypothetical protein